MSAREILFHHDAREQMASGVDALANTVRVTLGPRGRNVLLEASFGPPAITKDGASVAREIELSNPFANLGAQMVKEVAARTAELAGDGTTTATVLAQAIFTEGVKLVAAGAAPMELKRGIDIAAETIAADLKRQSKPTRGREEVAQVATISANGDRTVGELIAEALEKVGKEGVVTVEEAQSMETTLEVALGMQFDRGYISPYFVTDAERMEVVLEGAYILLHEKRISAMYELMPVLELVAKAGKPLLVIAEDIDGEALSTLVVNKLRGTLQICAVKAPGFGERRRDLLKDIAALVGGKAVTEDLGIAIDKLTLEDLGRAKTITVTKDATTLVDGAGDKAEIQGRLKQLRAQLEDTPSEYDREKLRERLAKLGSGVAIIKVGAATETEMKAKKARVEDALHATRAASEEGIVPGGGVALLRTLPVLRKLALGGDRQSGVDVVIRAVEEPLRQMARNAGLEGAVVVNAVLRGEGAHGFNVATGVYEDLIVAGVIDPTKVVRVALMNAASVASIMLTTEAMIARRQSAEGASDEMGGMGMS